MIGFVKLPLYKGKSRGHRKLPFMLSSFFGRAASEGIKEVVGEFFKKEAIDGINKIIITTSNKGGVGKSTVALNTAIALSEAGKKVGIFDANIYDPSLPTMANTLNDNLQQSAEGHFLPISAYGIQTITVGNGVDRDSALLWKGPFVGQLLAELLKKSEWDPVDYLIIDAPPGTGDVQLCLAANLPIDGAVVVTTPDKLSETEVEREMDSLKKLQIPVVGIVENKSGYLCPGCKKVHDVLPGTAGENLSKKYNCDFIGKIPLDYEISQSVDGGFPIVLANSNHPSTDVFRSIATKIMAKAPITAEVEQKE